MTRTKLYTTVIFSFAAATVDFLTMEHSTVVFPRDRLLHIAASLLCAIVFAKILNCISFDKKTVRYVAFAAVIFRMLFLWYSFKSFIHTFHGSQTMAVTVTTLAVIYLFIKYGCKGTDRMYSFFAGFNVTLVLFIVLMSITRLDVANIYANSQAYAFSMEKMFFFYDAITIAMLCSDKEQRWYVQKRYFILTTFFMTVITLVQGLSVSGNLMYSLSPLQTLMQIFTSGTVRRFDFIITLYCTLNYFAAVMLYVWTLLTLLQKEIYNETT